jgi:glycosyltransferase involved in cell wall biosynthesis
VPYIDEFDLAEKLQRVLRDGSLVQAYRQRAQLRIRTHYDWETVVDQYERLFAGMCGQAIEESSEEPEPAQQADPTEISTRA